MVEYASHETNSCFDGEVTFNRGPSGRHEVGKASDSAVAGVDYVQEEPRGGANAVTVGQSSELRSATYAE